MAIPIKIHPLDFESNVAIGIDLPMITDAGGVFSLNYLTMDQAVANAKNLLLTNEGERVMQPEFGCNLRKTLFENLTDETLEALDERIRATFGYWLPYIFIKELRLTPDEDYYKLFISLTIGLVGNKFDTRSIEVEINTQQNG